MLNPSVCNLSAYGVYTDRLSHTVNESTPVAEGIVEGFTNQDTTRCFTIAFKWQIGRLKDRSSFRLQRGIEPRLQGVTIDNYTTAVPSPLGTARVLVLSVQTSTVTCF